ncbi:hypothetical protein ABIA32_004031 [Streptacidiphilus sp. MAP12-20]
MSEAELGQVIAGRAIEAVGPDGVPVPLALEIGLPSRSPRSC